jgi:hypothetical protein
MTPNYGLLNQAPQLRVNAAPCKTPPDRRAALSNAAAGPPTSGREAAKTGKRRTQAATVQPHRGR